MQDLAEEFLKFSFFKLKIVSKIRDRLFDLIN